MEHTRLGLGTRHTSIGLMEGGGLRGGNRILLSPAWPTSRLLCLVPFFWYVLCHDDHTVDFDSSLTFRHDRRRVVFRWALQHGNERREGESSNASQQYFQTNTNPDTRTAHFGIHYDHLVHGTIVRVHAADNKRQRYAHKCRGSQLLRG